MKRIFILFLYILIFIPTNIIWAQKLEEKEPVDYVNPFMDSHKSRFFYFSSASRPFGMVNLSPDTNVKGSWNSGYMYDSTYIRCLSHVHAWQLSGIPVLPTVGEMKGHLGMDVYKSSFTHEGEIARPGYHKVMLQDYNIVVELTSTTRVGMHRYTYPKAKDAYILFDVGAFLGHSSMDFSQVRKVNNKELEGYSVMSPTSRRPKSTSIYFVAILDKPMSSFGGWVENKIIHTKTNTIEGKNAGAYIHFSTKENEQVQMKVAISYVSIEQARKNLETELPHWNFDQICMESKEEWNKELARIKVEGGTEEQKIKFYTDLWHSLLGRRIISDVDGKYPDNTGEKFRVGQAPLDKHGKPWNHYNFDAWWGSHWSLNILWSMVYPEIMDGFCNTMVSMYKDGGLIPRGPSGGNYTYVMIGDPSTSFFATAYNKGIRNYNIDLAYEGLRKNAFLGGIRDHAGYEHQSPAFGGGMQYYLKQGWIPERIQADGGHKDGCAQTLEYAYQDWCLAQLAKALGKNDDYNLFMQRSKNYKNVWDSVSGYMRPREFDGTFVKDFIPAGVESRGRDFGFCESNSAVYTHFVPHDMPGLISLFGGRDAYVRRLNKQFELARKDGFQHGNGRAGWVQYTNQPGTGMLHLFNHAGAPWLTQKWGRIVGFYYGDTSPYGGYYDDEDQGQMGALFALIAIGLFEVDGGASLDPKYEISSPIFDKIEISLNPDYYPGGKFVIKTYNNNSDNMYIQSAKLNGKPLNKYYFSHEDFIRGGTLELYMGDKPNKTWGVD